MMWHRCTSCRQAMEDRTRVWSVWQAGFAHSCSGFLLQQGKRMTSQVPQSSFTHERLCRLRQPHQTNVYKPSWQKVEQFTGSGTPGQEWGMNKLPHRLEWLLKCHTHCNNICPREWSLISMVGILIMYSMLWDQLHPILLSHLQGGCHSFLRVCHKDMRAGKGGNRPLPKYCQDWQT